MRLPRAPRVPWLYWFFKWSVVRPFLQIAYRPVLVNDHHLPARGPALLVSNHLEVGETVLLPALLRRRLVFPAKREAFEGRGFNRVLGWFLPAVGQMALDRSGGRASADGLGQAGEVLERGEILAMFPEGTRSPDGRLYKGHTGAARLALEFDVPVIPVGVTGTKLGLSGERPTITFGKPMRFSQYAGQAKTRDLLRWVTNEIMSEIQALTGQTYVDIYGTGAKQAFARGENVDHRIKPSPSHGSLAPVGDP